MSSEVPIKKYLPLYNQTTFSCSKSYLNLYVDPQRLRGKINRLAIIQELIQILMLICLLDSYFSTQQLYLQWLQLIYRQARFRLRNRQSQEEEYYTEITYIESYPQQAKKDQFRRRYRQIQAEEHIGVIYIKTYLQQAKEDQFRRRHRQIQAEEYIGMIYIKSYC